MSLSSGTEDEDLIEIFGTRGSLRLSTFGDDPVVVRWKEVKVADAKASVADAKAYAKALREALVHEVRIPFKRPEHVQQPLLELVVADLLSGGAADPKPESGAENALRCAKALDEALKGFYGHRGDGFWQTK